MASSKRAFVTGGSRGIGRCIAETLARDGCDVAIYYQGTAEEGRGVANEIEKHGRGCRAFIGDVRDVAQLTEAVETLAGEWGGIDVLVNNAGIVRDQVIWKMSDDDWRDVIDVDLSGVFHACRAVLPVMRKNEWGAIVNIASINGLRGKFGQTNYSAAKAGVIGLTKSLAKEAARFNITVNAIAPGFIETEIVKLMSPEARRQALEEILLGRPGCVEDVAETVAFLCSDRARFITGEVIKVDGGQYV